MDDNDVVEDKESESVLKRKTAFRFKGCTDVELPKEVIHVRPFEAPHGEVKKRWTEITKHVQRIYGQTITVNGARERYDDLMSAFQEQTFAALRASGTDEEYDEREKLLGAEEALCILLNRTSSDSTGCRGFLRRLRCSAGA
ncbi:hypothetical protein DYB34_011798 [Aphanomyces astaci]|uniref:MADF domain-containing protein n=1 Tax=Aphanomyces astaci TaxID=112090 RepID=A0A418BM32_APHAT|nr:hypothetical protein DYB34_011798 [Aphanomyces astaci]